MNAHAKTALLTIVIAIGFTQAPAKIKSIKRQELKFAASDCQAFRPAVRMAWYRLQRKYGELAELVASFEKDYETTCQACKDKAYTQQERAAAGCLPTDTEAQCNHKLWNRCINTVSLTAGHLLLCMRIQEAAASAKELEEKFFNMK